MKLKREQVQLALDYMSTHANCQWTEIHKEDRYISFFFSMRDCPNAEFRVYESSINVTPEIARVIKVYRKDLDGNKHKK